MPKKIFIPDSSGFIRIPDPSPVIIDWDVVKEFFPTESDFVEFYNCRWGMMLRQELREKNGEEWEPEFCGREHRDYHDPKLRPFTYHFEKRVAAPGRWHPEVI